METLNYWINRKFGKMSNPKRPRDPNQFAKLIVDIATGQAQEDVSKKNPAAVALGRLGGKVGGRSRANKLTAKERSDIAKKAAEKRWSSKK